MSYRRSINHLFPSAIIEVDLEGKGLTLVEDHPHYLKLLDPFKHL
jgi:hypothetical protein